MSKIITPKRKNFRHLPTQTGRFGLHMQLSNKAIMIRFGNDNRAISRLSFYQLPIMTHRLGTLSLR